MGGVKKKARRRVEEKGKGGHGKVEGLVRSREEGEVKNENNVIRRQYKEGRQKEKCTKRKRRGNKETDNVGEKIE